ncbi:DNA repair protein RecO [Acinetobacter sp. HY1485]|uniref:DNA repair protein RecO n=1 Tax=Acinetobacter sp. HY1485 TaxID=2970918 RepID=UPI0022B9BA1D|nr:DNA repair protein RecO C-terminal domain-containing protein [Acinetobacter sp. HY1485]
MRNELLQGYLIHHRKYRERSHIVHLFTQEYGRIDGVLRQTPPPQFQPIQLLASGRSELKNFSKLEIQHQPIFFHGDAFFCGFYLNELILRLCALEEPMPQTFAQYTKTLQHLQKIEYQEHKTLYLKQLLRKFELVILSELGYSLDYTVDHKQAPIVAEQFYSFHLNEGFVPLAQKAGLKGEDILSMSSYNLQEFNSQQLTLLSRLYRQIISALLGDRPLKSRQLWVQQR